MDLKETDRIVGSSMTVSDKIRALNAQGHPRAQIARLLGKRYQHVRNVLEADGPRESGPVGAWPGAAETPRPFAGPYVRDVEDRGGGVFRLTLREDGSVMIPPAVRASFRVKPGQPLMARLDGDEFKLITAATAWRRIDELMAPYRDPARSVVDEFIAERRAEAARENGDG